MRVLFVWRICSAICGLVISRDEQKHPLIKVSLYAEVVKKMLKFIFLFHNGVKSSFIGDFVEKVSLIKVFIFVRILLKLRRCDEAKLLILCICENEQDGVKVWDIDVIEWYTI